MKNPPIIIKIPSKNLDIKYALFKVLFLVVLNIGNINSGIPITANGLAPYYVYSAAS